MRIVICISDLQIPFHHRDSLPFIKHVIKVFVPKNVTPIIMNMGDEVDQAGMSLKYSPNPNGKSSGDELQEAKIVLAEWAHEFPKMLLCTSNHTYRAYKKGFHAGLPQEFFKSLNDVYELPSGWKWSDRWFIDGICFEHGEFVSGQTAALTAAMQNRMSTVIGHQHSHGGVIWSGSIGGNIFGLNTGCLIDVDAYAFEYGKKLRKKPTLGCGVILNGVPLFIPMRLNSKKRWIGRL